MANVKFMDYAYASQPSKTDSILVSNEINGVRRTTISDAVSSAIGASSNIYLQDGVVIEKSGRTVIVTSVGTLPTLYQGLTKMLTVVQITGASEIRVPMVNGGSKKIVLVIVNNSTGVKFLDVDTWAEIPNTTDTVLYGNFSFISVN